MAVAGSVVYVQLRGDEGATKKCFSFWSCSEGKRRIKSATLKRAERFRLTTNFETQSYVPDEIHILLICHRDLPRHLVLPASLPPYLPLSIVERVHRQELVKVEYMAGLEGAVPVLDVVPAAGFLRRDVGRGWLRGCSGS
jgi:hypothetical protein